MTAATGSAAQLLNISTRLNVQPADDVLIGGFIISGSDPKKVIIRAIGPSLRAAGVDGTLSDPTLELHDSSGATIASNDNWKETQQAEIQATGIPPANELESAIVRTLSPGAYTAIVRGRNGATGVGLVEAYDLAPSANSKLANISTRGFVGNSGNVMIGGFIAGPAGAGAGQVAVRAIGPSLSAAGVSGALQDPTLELHDGNGATLSTNDNWQDTQPYDVESSGLVPRNDAESVVVTTVVPGNYTAIVRGKNNGTGVGLVEVYDITGHDSRVLASPPKNVLVNNPNSDPSLYYHDFEPSLAVFGSKLVVGWSDEGENHGQYDIAGISWGLGYAYSGDNGASFTDAGGLPSPWGADAGLAADRAGNIYFSRIDLGTGFNAFGDPKDRIAVYKSTDGGITFASSANASTQITSGSHDKPLLAVDNTGGPFDGNVYVSWTDAVSNVLNIGFSRSTDGGSTFSNRITLSSGSFNQSSMPTVGPNGEVYVVWADKEVNRIMIRKSTDGGVSFAPATVVANVTPSGVRDSRCGLVFPNGAIRSGFSPVVAVDKSTTSTMGKIYIVFHGDPDGAGPDQADVYLTSSTDGGSWSSPIQLNDDKTFNDQWEPFVTVAPNGVLAAMWYDRRGDTQNNLIDVFMTISSDGGASFGPNFRVTDQSFPAPDAFQSGCVYLASYNWLVADSKYFYLAWTDVRMRTARGALDPNIFFARVPVPPPAR